MSDTRGERFALRASPPVRALAIAALAAVVGTVLMVLSRALGLGPVALVIGMVVMVLAVALALAAVIVVAWLRSTLVLDAEAITVVRGQRARRLPWADIERVSLSGRRLTLVTEAAGGDVSVLNPRVPTDPTFLALVGAIRRRLDADRGYRTG